MPTYKQNLSDDLLPDGTYPFYVRNCKESENKNKDPMFVMMLEITAPNGEVFPVWDNLNFGGPSAKRIDQFRMATGEVLGAAGTDVSIEPEDFIGRRGLCIIETTEYQGAKKNSVNYNGYVIRPKSAQAAAPVPAARASNDTEPDDIPF